jgi:hypothetical protein
MATARQPSDGFPVGITIRHDSQHIVNGRREGIGQEDERACLPVGLRPTCHLNLVLRLRKFQPERGDLYLRQRGDPKG